MAKTSKKKSKSKRKSLKIADAKSSLKAVKGGYYAGDPEGLLEDLKLLRERGESIIEYEKLLRKKGYI